MKEKITIMALSRQAGVSYDRAHRWIWERKIPAVKDARGRWVIDRAEAEQFIRERKARRAGNVKSVAIPRIEWWRDNRLHQGILATESEDVRQIKAWVFSCLAAWGATCYLHIFGNPSPKLVALCRLLYTIILGLIWGS